MNTPSERRSPACWALALGTIMGGCAANGADTVAMVLPSADLGGDPVDAGFSADLGQRSVDSGSPSPISNDAGTMPDVSKGTDVVTTEDIPLAVFDGGACLAESLGSRTGNNLASGNTTGRANRSSGTCGAVPDAGTAGGELAPEAAFEWRAPRTGTVQIDTRGSALDTVLYVREASCAGREIACQDDIDTLTGVYQSSVRFPVVADAVYLIFVDGYGSNAGTYALNVNYPSEAPDAAVPMDSGAASCAAVSLGTRVGDGVATGTTAGATGRLAAATPGCGTPSGTTEPGGLNAPEAVFEWTAPASGVVTFDTAGSTFDTLLYVRAGSCTGLEAACNDDGTGLGLQSRLSLAVVAGQRYHLVVDGFSRLSGSYRLNITYGSPGSDAGVPVDVVQPVDTSIPTPRWTVFVYGHADHSLSLSLLNDMAEMSRASLGSNVRVIVMADWDASASYLTSSGVTPFPSGTEWYQIPGDSRPPVLLRRSAEQDLDDPSVLTEAIRYTFATYPADRYGVILWDHGGSWEMGYGGDSENTGHLDPTLRRWGDGMSASAAATAVRTGMSLAGIRGTRPLDFVAFDTCLMGAAETAFPFRDIAKVYLAEAEVDFNNGWDYQASLSRLGRNPSVSAVDFARGELADWSAHHTVQPGSTGADQLIRSAVALDLAQLDGLAAAARAFTSAMLADPMMSTPQVARAAARSLPIYSPGLATTTAGKFRDLGQFLDGLRAVPLASVARAAVSEFDRALNAAVIATDQGSRRSAARQRGVQIALPQAISFNASLQTIYRSGASEWASASRWSEFLSAMAPGTRPAPSVDASWRNLSNADGTTRPQVSFRALGDANEARVAVFQADLASPIRDFSWRLLGFVANGLIDPGAYYSFTWNGMQVALPDGQPLVTLPFLQAYDAGMMTSYDLSSTLGACVRPGAGSVSSRTFACALVWTPLDLQVSLVVDITHASSPSYESTADLTATGPLMFTPARVYQANDGRQQIAYGRAYTVGIGGRLTLRDVQAPAGTYEFDLVVMDVFGRVGGVTQFATTRLAFGP